MGSPTNVVKAIESFSSWDRPWEFYSNVSMDPCLNGADREWLEQTWSAACDHNLWPSADRLAEGAATVETALRERFPLLSTLACQQLAKAASYQWR